MGHGILTISTPLSLILIVKLLICTTEVFSLYIFKGVLQALKEEFSISVVSVGDRERREINQAVDVLLAPPGTLMSMLYRSK